MGSAFFSILLVPCPATSAPPSHLRTAASKAALMGVVVGCVLGHGTKELSVRASTESEWVARCLGRPLHRSQHNAPSRSKGTVGQSPLRRDGARPARAVSRGVVSASTPAGPRSVPARWRRPGATATPRASWRSFARPDGAPSPGRRERSATPGAGGRVRGGQARRGDDRPPLRGTTNRHPRPRRRARPGPPRAPAP